MGIYGMSKVDQYPLLSLDKSQNDNHRREIQDAFGECYNQAFRSWGTWINEADKDLAFYLGDQWDASEKAILKSQKRAALVFNKIRRVIKMIEGFERKTRVSLIANPVELNDEKLSDQFSQALLWQMNKAKMHMVMSDAFAGALKTGMNLVALALDYTRDPLSGDITLSRLPHNSYLIDPRFTRRDLSDCEYILQRKFLSKDAIKALLPFRADEIDFLTTTERDEKFPFMFRVRDADNKETLAFDEFWVKRHEDIVMLVDVQTGEMKRWTAGQDRLNAILQLPPEVRVAMGFPANPKVRRHFEKRIELNVLVNGNLMYSGPDPWGLNEFPHIPIMTFFDPEFVTFNNSSEFDLKVQGIIRSIRDPQTELNKRRSKALDIVDSQVNSGWKAKEGAVTNPRDLYQAGQGKVIWMKEEAQMTDAERILPGDFPQSFLQLSEMFDKDLMEIAGANSEIFGMPENENTPISGILAKVRQGAGLTILQDIFDYYRMSQEMLGEKVLQLMQVNYHPTKLTRILGERPLPQFFDLEVGKFDIDVEEAIETPSQKQLFYMQLLQARQVGIAIPDSLILKYMPIQKKDEIIKVLEAQEQAAAQAAQAETEQRQQINALSQAKVTSDLSLAAERRSKIVSDMALAQERVSESRQNNAKAVLDMVKSVVEIDQLSDDRILKLLSFVMDLQREQFQQSQQVLQNEKQEQQEKVAQTVGKPLLTMAKNT